MKVTILGAGHIGQAIFNILKDDVTANLWDKNPNLIANQAELSDVVDGADLIFLCVPTHCVRELAEDIATMNISNSLLVSVSKGLEAVTGKFAYEIIEEVLPNHSFALLLGPTLSKELGSFQGGAATVASSSSNALANLQSVLNNQYIILDSSDDVPSQAMASILKNIYTVLIGIARGLDYGYNIEGYLQTKALSEMSRIAVELGNKTDAIYGMAGMADFLATSSSDSSQNILAGIEFAQGNKTIKSEGVRALPEFIKKIKDVSAYPLLQVLQKVILGDGIPKAEFKKIL